MESPTWHEWKVALRPRMERGRRVNYSECQKYSNMIADKFSGDLREIQKEDLSKADHKD